jgi:hypothetical protein
MIQSEQGFLNEAYRNYLYKIEFENNDNWAVDSMKSNDWKERYYLQILGRSQLNINIILMYSGKCKRRLQI